MSESSAPSSQPCSSTSSESAAPVPPTAARPSVPTEIRVLLAASFVIALGFGIIAPVLPRYATSFGVGVAGASLIVSAFAFCRLVFAPGGGALISRFGERPVYITGLLIVALSTAATGFANSYEQLLIFRGLGGIGSTMFTVSAMGLIVRLSPPTIRGRISGYYATSFLLGNILGPVLGGVLAPYGMRVPFFVYAAALVVAALVVFRYLSGANLRPEPGSTPLPVMTLAQAWENRAYRAGVASGFAGGWVNIGVRMSILPLFAAATPGLGDVAAATSLTLFAVGNALALQAGGRLVDTRGRKGILMIGLVVTGFATIALGVSAHLVPFLVLSALAGMGAGLTNPAQQAAVADVVGSDRNGGKVLAYFQMAMDIGAISGPIIAGLVADHLGYGWAFALSGAVCLGAVIAWSPAPDTLPGRSRSRA